ncbi:outer membrane lipoprotein-sorting protein [Halorubrum vacuolatum]|uniref:Outer membrane lipoprotein-sorting protein n=1 Tax=Halorubrum vacuolatum TaxID=63740 RepID=A0A238WV72_HALVU|nr:hypothetical protein [Halorubrum vacuolatum]SNR50447.1 Outer membrane lipoprotein-sorting protein [Halorubrum vacuolatum]
MIERSTFALLLTVALLAGVGFGFHLLEPAQSAEDDPNQLINETVNEHPDAIDGTLQTVVRHNDTVVDRRTYEMTDRPETDERRVHIEGSDGNATIVENETVSWLYDEADEEVQRVDTDELSIVVPAIEFDTYADAAETFTVEHHGTTEVLDRETHELRLTPPEAEASAALELIVGETEYEIAAATIDGPLVVTEHRLWIDAEYAHPLKERTTITGADDESVVLIREFEHVEFEAVPDDSVFEFDPPADAEVSEPPTWDEYDSLTAAGEAVPYAVPDPTLPDDYTFREASVRPTEESAALSVRYADEDEWMSVTVEPERRFDPVGVSVDIDGREGTVLETHGGTAVHWECGEFLYIVGGSASVDEQIAVAESIDCAPPED